MQLKNWKLSTIQNLMPRLNRVKNASSITSQTKQTNRKTHQNPSASLPELPNTSRLADQLVASESPGRNVGTSEKHKGKSSSKVAVKNKTVSQSSSDSLVSSFRNLTIKSRTSSRISAASSKSGRRYLSTFTVSNVDAFASLIKSEQCKNIIVMAGAGISTPSGIPDFRSPGIGLYDNLVEYDLPDPTAVFDIGFFAYNPKPFFRLAKELYPGKYFPNIVHHFVKLLHDRGLLLRMYTQNIDALERAAGVPESKLVEAHGSFATATCRRCKSNYKGEEIFSEVMNQEVPKCRETGCSGVIKPDIVFFGEDLPRKFFMYPKDFAKCDMLIVLGTSLEVEPFAGLVNEVSRSVPRLLINRDVVGPFVRRKKRSNDVVIKGDIIDGVNKLLTALSWKNELDDIAEKYEKKDSKRS